MTPRGSRPCPTWWRVGEGRRNPRRGGVSSVPKRLGLTSFSLRDRGPRHGKSFGHDVKDLGDPFCGDTGILSPSVPTQSETSSRTPCPRRKLLSRGGTDHCLYEMETSKVVKPWIVRPSPPRLVRSLVSYKTPSASVDSWRRLTVRLSSSVLPPIHSKYRP